MTWGLVVFELVLLLSLAQNTNCTETHSTRKEQFAAKTHSNDFIEIPSLHRWNRVGKRFSRGEPKYTNIFCSVQGSYLYNLVHQVGRENGRKNTKSKWPFWYYTYYQEVLFLNLPSSSRSIWYIHKKLIEFWSKRWWGYKARIMDLDREAYFEVEIFLQKITFLEVVFLYQDLW